MGVSYWSDLPCLVKLLTRLRVLDYHNFWNSERYSLKINSLLTKYGCSYKNVLQNLAKTSCYSMNSGLDEVQILALLSIFSPFWRLLAWIHTLFFLAFFFWSVYILGTCKVITQHHRIMNICFCCSNSTIFCLTNTYIVV